MAFAFVTRDDSIGLDVVAAILDVATMPSVAPQGGKEGKWVEIPDQGEGDEPPEIGWAFTTAGDRPVFARAKFRAFL